MPYSTKVMAISRISADGKDLGSRNSTVESGDMSKQAESGCSHDGSDGFNLPCPAKNY